MTPDRAPSGAVSKRRHGIVRRWVVRPAFWTLAVAALLFVSCLAYLESDDFAQRGSAWAIGWLEAKLGREVTASEVYFDIFPLSLEALDVEIEGQSPTDPAFVHARRLLVEATIGSLLRPGIALNRVYVEKPVATIGFSPEGQHDAPRWRRSGRENRWFDIEIDLLEVVDGSLDLEHERFPLDLKARGVRAGLLGGDGLEVRGRTVASSVEITLPDARPYAGAIDMEAVFRPGRVDVIEARFESAEATATASGIWKWRETRDVDLRIIADGRLELFETLGYLDDFGAGPVHFEGALRRLPGEWFLDGDFFSPQMTVLGRELRGVSGTAVGDQDAVRLDVQSARYDEGRVTGEILISLAKSGGKPVSLDLDFHDVPLQAVLRDQQIPLSGLEALVSGPLQYQFPRNAPRRGSGRGQLTVVPRGDSRPRGVAPDGTVQLTVRDGLVSAEAVHLRAETQVFLLSGEYHLESRTGTVEYSITSSEVEGLFPLLAELTDGTELWRPSSGRGTLRGDISVRQDGVVVTVRLDLEDVETTGFSAQRLIGSFGVTPAGVEDLYLELSRPAGALIASGTVPHEEAAGAVRQLDVSVESAGWPLQDVAAWLPANPGISGGFSGSVDLTGSPTDPRVAVIGTVAPVAWRDVEVRSLDIDLAAQGGSVEIESLRLELESGAVSASGRMVLAGSGSGDVRDVDDSIDLRIGSEGVRVEALPWAGLLGAEVVGDLEVDAHLHGAAGDPVLDAELWFGDLQVGATPVAHDAAGDELSGATPLKIGWRRGELEVVGEVGGLLDVEGRGRLDRSGVDLLLALDSDELGKVLVLAAGGAGDGISGHGRGALHALGSWDDPSTLEARIRLVDLQVRRKDKELDNLEPVVAVLNRGGLDVESLYLGEPGTASEAFFTGDIGIGDRPAVDLRMQATLATEWFQPWLEGVAVGGGDFQVIGTIGGRPGELWFDGQGEVRDARASVDAFSTSVESLSGLVLFYRDRIVLDEATALGAGGRLRAGGSIDLTGEGEKPFQFQLAGEDVSFVLPDGWLIRGDSDLTVASTPDGRVISGNARLTSALYAEDVQLIGGALVRERVEEGDVDPWRSQTQLNVAIEVPDGLRISNNVADLSGSADLGLRGSLARPLLFGTMELDKGGRLVYSGQEYTVERGQLTFTNPYRIEPIVDLVARARVREFDVTLGLSGTQDRLQTEFVSNPPLSELEVLALLTGGRDPGRRTLDKPATTAEGGAAETFLYGQATSLIAGRFNRLFGLDQFRIDPLTSGTGSLSSARITVGKQLSRDLFVTYSYDPSETEEQILELEWNVSRSFVLVLTQNGDGTYAVDARWEKAL